MMLIPSYSNYFPCLVHVIDNHKRSNMDPTHVLHRTFQRLELLRIFQYLAYLLCYGIKLRVVLLLQFLKYLVYCLNNFQRIQAITLENIVLQNS